MGEAPLRTGALSISAAAETLFGNCHICELSEHQERLELTGTKYSKEAWSEVIRNKVFHNMEHSKIGNIVEKRN